MSLNLNVEHWKGSRVYVLFNLWLKPSGCFLQDNLLNITTCVTPPTIVLGAVMQFTRERLKMIKKDQLSDYAVKCGIRKVTHFERSSTPTVEWARGGRRWWRNSWRLGCDVTFAGWASTQTLSSAVNRRRLRIVPRVDHLKRINHYQLNIGDWLRQWVYWRIQII